MAVISGSCFCRAVKYELSAESRMQGLCYCTDCQTIGGSSTGRPTPLRRLTFIWCEAL